MNLTASAQAEISCLENVGRLPGSAYKGATMYTTLSPCDMCTGACVMYGVKRVVIGISILLIYCRRVNDFYRGE
jgi:creatinine deaminase